MKTLRCLPVAVLLALGTPGAAAAQASTFSLSDVTQMIEAKFSTEQIIREIGTSCLSFAVAANETRLQRAGADATLVTALRAVCYRPPPAAQRDGTLNIIGELPRNWSRTANR